MGTSSEISSEIHKPHWAVLTPQLGTHPTPYLLPKCSQEPCFCQSVLKATHTPLRGSQGREGSEEAWLSVTTPSVCVAHGSLPPIPRLLEIPRGGPEPRDALWGVTVFDVSNVFWRGCVNSVTGVSGPPKRSPAGSNTFSLENLFSHHPRTAAALGWLKGSKTTVARKNRTVVAMAAEYSHLNSRGSLSGPSD